MKSSTLPSREVLNQGKAFVVQDFNQLELCFRWVIIIQTYLLLRSFKQVCRR